MENWLRCTITEGMFSDEKTVKVENVLGEAIAVFVPVAQVNEDRGLVQVKFIKNDEIHIAILPDDRHTLVSVKPADLQQA